MENEGTFGLPKVNWSIAIFKTNQSLKNILKLLF